MNGTLYSLDLLNSGIGLAAAGLIGVLFGFFLEQAGFGSSRKLTGIFYFRDMSVLKVMFTAVVVTLVGYQYLVAFGWLAPGQVYVLDTYWGAQIVGGLLFGVGFVMGGWCPGTAFVGVASAKLDAVVFLVGAVLGSILFSEVFPFVRPLYEGAHAGALSLPETLHLPPTLVVVLFCMAAVAAFAVSTWFEQRIGGKAPAAQATRRRNRRAALALIVAAVVTWFLPGRTLMPAAAEPAFVTRTALAPLLLEVDAGGDHIEPGEFAQLMMSAAPDLTVIDIRPEAAYAQFHLPGALNLPLAAMATQAAAVVPRTGRVVLVSNGTTHAAQAWNELRHLGWTNVTVLTDGMLGFFRDCLTPPSLAGVPLTPTAAQAAAEAFSKRRAFFLDRAGTSPRLVPSPGIAAAADTPALSAEPPLPAMAAPGLAQHLVDTEWLAAHLNDPALKVIDVRPKGTAYTTAHIPGALYMSMESLRSTIEGIPAVLVPAADIAIQLGRLGLTPRDTVVLYGDTLRDETFVAMALARVGHGAYAVLHGGLEAWIAEERPVTSEIPRPVPVVYKPVEGADTFTADIEAVKAALDDGRTRILDVRPAAYFAGSKSDEARAGHMPGAVNREFALDLAPGRELWQDTDVLRRAYRDLGLPLDTPIIVHCRTGHQASQTYFLLKHLLGYRDVRWFDLSWSGWAARPELPVAIGP